MRDPAERWVRGGLTARDWDDLASVDPYWAVLTWPDRRGNRWDLAEFLLTGETELASVLAVAEDLRLPATHGHALDVGCGVGRVTLAMSRRFKRCHGVDISSSMLRIAAQLADDRPNCTYSPMKRDGALAFDDGIFDFVYCSRVLQHLSGGPSIERMIGELVRVLTPGGLLVFQLPERIPPRHRIQARRRIYRVLRGAGVSEKTMIGRMRLTPMAMRAIDPIRVQHVIQTAGGILVTQRGLDISQKPIPQAVYFVTRDGPTRSS